MLFVMDTKKVRLGGWYGDVKGIVDVAVFGDDIYILHSNQAARDEATKSGAAILPHLARLASLVSRLELRVCSSLGVPSSQR